MVLKLSSLSVLKDEGEVKVDLEGTGLTWKDIFNALGNVFSNGDIGVVEESKVDS